MASSTYACSKLPRCKLCFDAKELQTDPINQANYCAICRACLKHTTQCGCSKQNGHVISAKGTNGHVLNSGIKKTISNFQTSKQIGSEKFLVHLKLPWIGNICPQCSRVVRAPEM